MKIMLELEPELELGIADNLDEATVATLLAELPQVKAIAVKVGEDSYFEAFPISDDMGDRAVRELASAALSSEDFSVDAYVVENDWDQNASDYYYDNNVSSDLKRDLTNVVDSIVNELDHLDADEILSNLEELLRETVTDAMIQEDTSTSVNLIPSHADVEVSFIPDTHVLGIDDLYLHHHDVCFSVETAIPDANFMRALKFFNVSLSDFVNEASARGIELANPVIGENVSEYARERIEANALHWRAALEVLDTPGMAGNIRKLPLRSQYEINQWNESVTLIKTAKDHDRSAALSMDDLFVTLDNASYGGVPTYIMRLPLKDMLAGKLRTPFVAEGGFIGIHDFLNGSGYIERPSAPVLIDPSKGSFHTTNVDDVYGIVKSYYKAKITAFEVPKFQRIKENVWHKEAADGRQVEITKTTGSDGGEEYWVQTLDDGGSAAGPRETHEVYISLEDAFREGDAVLSEEWKEENAPSI